MHARASLFSALAIAAVLLVPAASAAVTTVNLRTADPFAILAGAGITNTGATTVKGDVGSHLTPDQTGFGPGANSVSITGTLTLNGLDDPDSIFIFQSGSTLVTASASKVVLTRGAQACNIYWQVGSSATLGSGSHLEGTILALTSITLDHEATINGRALARNGAVTLDANTVQIVPCEAQPAPTTSTSPTSSPSPTTTSSPTSTPSSSTPPPTTTPPGTTGPPTTSPPPAIPFFPTTAAVVVAAAAALGSVLLIMRNRLR